MTETVPSPATVAAPPATATTRGRWIEVWDPENPTFWQRTGARIARRNLVFSIFTEHIGFSI